MMHKLFIVSLIMLFSICGASAQEKQEDSQSNKGAKLVFANVEYDYGTIPKGGDGNCVFEFVNEGDEPLIISYVRVGCGCTVPRWPRVPIMPGEKGEIKVRYSTDLTGTFNKMLTVHSNSAGRPSIILTIKGEIVKQ